MEAIKKFKKPKNTTPEFKKLHLYGGSGAASRAAMLTHVQGPGPYRDEWYVSPGNLQAILNHNLPVFLHFSLKLVNSVPLT